MSTRTLEFSLEPVDNHQLASLCGPLDENLRQIEQCFDVTLARRSAHFKIQGTGASRERAAKALRFFYELAGHNKEPLSIDDLQLGLIELRQDPKLMIKAGPARDDADLGASDSPVLLTKRADLHGRTPRQVEYLKNIQAHDITFGIGPAGTGKTFLA
ncbi:MAG: PhoH family protein, partial [Fluviibacter sp.]